VGESDMRVRCQVLNFFATIKNKIFRKRERQKEVLFLYYLLTSISVETSPKFIHQKHKKQKMRNGNIYGELFKS
jgi:hypothetical protein